MKTIPSLRISVTKECNLCCAYCHGEGQVEMLASRTLTPKEFSEIVRTGVEFGVRKVKLTGGEPLLREDITEIVQGIASVRESDYLGLSTNGTLLEERAKDLKRAGLRKVNVSLDTLREDVYERLTGFRKLKEVLGGVKAALSEGFEVELNTVVLRGLNEKEIPSLLNFAAEQGCNLQLIELVESQKEFYRKHHLSLRKVEAYLAQVAEEVIPRKSRYDRPVFIIDGIRVSVCSNVRSLSGCTGRRCHGLRVTADGYLRGFSYIRSKAIPLDTGCGASLRRSFIKALESLGE